jgi:hypothetical protein
MRTGEPAWRDAADSAMAAIMDRAEVLSRDVTDPKQLDILGRLVGEMIIAGMKVRKGEVSGKQKEQEDEGDE